MTKVLVTGSNGFIGSNLLPKLKILGYEVIALNRLDGDIALSITWENLPKVDVVIHLAAKSIVPESWKKNYDYIQCNLLGTLNALNYCKKHNAKLIFTSSYLYGNPETLPVNESAKIIASNPYGLSKKLAEDTCEFFAKNENIDVVIIRPFNIYGPGQSNDYLIQSVIYQVKNTDSINVKDLEPKRDYIFIDDVSDAIIQSIQVTGNFNIFNLGTGQSYSVLEIIDIIQDLFGTSHSVLSSDERRKGEIMDTVADNSRAQSLLNWSPKYSLKDGIKKIFDSFNNI